MSEVIDLASPIEAHGETLSQLTFRRPTAQEARAIKALPYRIDKNEEVSWIWTWRRNTSPSAPASRPRRSIRWICATSTR